MDLPRKQLRLLGEDDPARLRRAVEEAGFEFAGAVPVDG